MFKVTNDPRFTHEVPIRVPVDGGYVDQSLQVTFRVLPIDQLSSDGSTEGQKEDLRRLIAKLDDLVDDNDKPVTYSDAIRDQLIELPYVRVAMIRAYTQAVTKTKEGN